MNAAVLLGQWVFFLRKFEMADEYSYSTDTSVSGAVKKITLTTILLAHIRIFTRLVMVTGLSGVQFGL